MPPAYEVLLLNTAIPQIQAAQAGDTYVVPRDIAFTSNLTLNAGTANGVVYLNASKVATTGSALTFDGTNFATTGSGTLKNLLLTGGTLPGAGTPSISLRSSDNVVYHQSGSANTIVLLDSSQNTMQSIGATAQVWNISNIEQMRLNSSGLEVKQSQLIGYSSFAGIGSNGLAVLGNVGIGTSSPAYKLDVSGMLNVGWTAGSGIIAQFQRTQAGEHDLQLVSGNATGAGIDSTGALTFGSGATLGTFGTPKMTLDTSGNLGLGVTPGAWGSTYRASQIGLSSSLVGITNDTQTHLTTNGYFNGTNWIYIANSPASRYMQDNNSHKWFNAASGTAGDTITFTQAMTLDASGNLGVGATSPAAKFQTQQTSAGSRVTGALLQNVGDTANTAVSLDFAPHENTTTPEVLARINAIRTNSSNAPTDLVFSVFNVTLQERARITSGGDFRVKGAGTAGSTDAFQVSGSAPADAARLDSSGNFLVGATSQSGVYRSYINGLDVLMVNCTGTGVSGTPIRFERAGSSSGATYALFSTANATEGSITSTAGGTAYNTSSDYRLKDNPQPLTTSGAFIDALKPKTWNWKSDGSKGVGFIAHEVQEVSPGTVVGAKDAVDADGKPIMQAMEYGSAEFIANIVAELQSLRARVAQLEQGA